MDKATLLQQFSRELDGACRARDWAQLAAIDARLGSALRRWPTGTPWTDTERRALDALQRSHARAREFCAAELQQLDASLAQMRAGRDRWSAYAASNGWDQESAA
jgi:hypothetical protein